MYKPLPDTLELAPSLIDGMGLYAKETIDKGTNLGMSHLEFGNNIIRTPLGGFVNHSDDPNCNKVKLKFVNEDDQPEYQLNKWNLIAIKDIKAGEELTLEYTFYKI